MRREDVLIDRFIGGEISAEDFDREMAGLRSREAGRRDVERHIERGNNGMAALMLRLAGEAHA